jgi:transcriptional regulator with XRE-family HTH domain
MFLDIHMSMNVDSPSWASQVAGAIRAEMAWQKRTGVDLAKHLGVAQPTISKRLNGETPFDLDEIERVAEWLGVAPSELIARADRVTAVSA